MQPIKKVPLLLPMVVRFHLYLQKFNFLVCKKVIWIHYTYNAGKVQHFSIPSIISIMYLTSFGACCCKKQIDISFLCVSPLIEDKFRHNIVKVFNLSSKLGLARTALCKWATCTRQTCLSKTLFIQGIWPVSGLVIVKNKLTSVLCVSSLIEDKFRHNIVKVFNLSVVPQPLWQCYDAIYLR